MGEQEHILDIYASIALTTGQMLEAAQGSDWDRLVELEQDCCALIDTLKRANAHADASTRFVQRKAAFIRKALADDAQIRRITEPWIAQLEAYLGNARQAHRLRRAYDTDSGSPT